MIGGLGGPRDRFTNPNNISVIEEEDDALLSNDNYMGGNDDSLKKTLGNNAY